VYTLTDQKGTPDTEQERDSVHFQEYPSARAHFAGRDVTLTYQLYHLHYPQCATTVVNADEDHPLTMDFIVQAVRVMCAEIARLRKVDEIDSEPIVDKLKEALTPPRMDQEWYARVCREGEHSLPGVYILCTHWPHSNGTYRVRLELSLDEMLTAQ